MRRRRATGDPLYMKKVPVVACVLGTAMLVAAPEPKLDPTGLMARPGFVRVRMPTTHPGVTFEVDDAGGARFYSSVQPFVGLAITPDGRNLYVGR